MEGWESVYQAVSLYKNQMLEAQRKTLRNPIRTEELALENPVLPEELHSLIVSYLPFRQGDSSSVKM